MLLEIGHRLARYQRRRSDGEKESSVGSMAGSTGAMVGAMLGLLAFMLAFTFGMATSFFQARREVVLSEANAIGTTYLRAAMLPESIGNLTSLEKLVLFGAQDPRAVDESDPVPRERHKFPAGMSRLKNLVYLDLGRNGLDEIPVFVKDLPRLQHLGFAWNGAKKLPPFLAGLHELTTIQLDSDDLSDLPGFLNTLPRLSYISLGGNCAITQKPTKMRDLKKRFPRISFDFENEYDCP